MRWAIIILNWNGWEDTLECLASVWLQSFQQFDVILIDNHSTDDSIKRILKWTRAPYIPRSSVIEAQQQYPLPTRISVKEISEKDRLNVPNDEAEPSLFLIRNPENLGFARGSNVGIRIAQQAGYSHIMLLNNDAVLAPQALEFLPQAMKRYPEYAAYQAAIYHYHQPERIWNVGGRIFPWGQTRYYRHAASEDIRETQTINGCALVLPMTTIQRVGLLSEQFFHGEEDFHYAMKLKRANLKACVVNKAIVYHKVSMSVSKQWAVRRQRLTNGALNRLIHFKQVYSPLVWNIWRIGTLAYYWGLLVLKYHQPPGMSWRLIKAIGKKAKQLERVTPEIVEAILTELQ